MPWAIRRCGGRNNRSVPASSAVPLAGNAPISARISVVLPAPLRPISPHISPAASSSDTLRMMATAPIETLRLATLSMIAIRGCGLEFRSADKLLYARIGKRGRRRSVCNHRAVVEGKHAVGVTADNVHIVLDEQHSNPAIFQRRHHHV